MILLEQAEVRFEWVDFNSLHQHPTPDLHRSPGLHVSEIIRAVALQPSLALFTEEDRDDEAPLCVALGMGWEWIAARLYPEMNWQPGEVEREGIFGSPDGISLISGEFGKYILTDEPVIDEFKFTGKSQRVKGAKPMPNGTLLAKDLKDIRTEWMWMQQGMSYCNMHDLRPTVARFHICWSKGPYTYPMKGVYMRYLVKFEPHELIGNWEMLTGHRHLIGG